MAFDIKKATNGNLLSVKLSGSFDSFAIKNFDAEFKILPKEANVIELDFSDVDYISSAGLRSLLILKKLSAGQDKKLLIKDPPETVKEVFYVTGFDGFLEIVHTKQIDDQKEESLNGYYPLRPIQSWLMDTHFYKADSTMMNNGALLKLDDTIDMERLAGALNDLLNDYDIFRCRLVFHPDTGEVCQRFDGTVSTVKVEMLSEELFDKRKAELKKPYKLIGRPLYRIYLMQTPSGKYIYADFYHAIMDGTAIVILFWREVNKRYRKKTTNRKCSSYAEYVLEEAEELKSDQEEGHRYWREVLSGFDPKKHLPPADISRKEEWRQCQTERALKNIKQDFFRIKRAYSENTFMLATAMLAMAKISGEKDVIMSWVHNARTTVKEMRLMGLMLNQYPIRWDFGEDMKVIQFLSGLEERINKGMFYVKALDEVYKNDLEGECATFILQKDTDIKAAYTLDNLPCQVMEIPCNKWSAAENVMDIAVTVLEDGGYHLTIMFDGDRFSNDTMERYAAIFDEMLSVLCKEDANISEILA